ncbi:MAG: hypothetical protein FJW14_06540 [Acidimicrobiia bacterium]|nr:hypothetical protein [Acidimicrobiia bacterium]
MMDTTTRKTRVAVMNAVHDLPVLVALRKGEVDAVVLMEKDQTPFVHYLIAENTVDNRAWV